GHAPAAALDVDPTKTLAANALGSAAVAVALDVGGRPPVLSTPPGARRSAPLARNGARGRLARNRATHPIAAARGAGACRGRLPARRHAGSGQGFRLSRDAGSAGADERPFRASQ